MYRISCRLAGLPGLAAVYFSWLVACPVLGQALVNPVPKVADYGRWGKLHLEQLSGDGKWVSFQLQYDNTDTLVVKSVDGRQSFCVAKAWQGMFSESGQFGCLTEKGFTCIDLKKGRLTEHDSIHAFAFLGDGAVLTGRDKGIVVFDRNGNIRFQQRDCNDWQLSPDRSKVAMITDSAVTIWERRKGSRCLFQAARSEKLSRLTFGRNGVSLAWTLEAASGNGWKKVFYHDLATDQVMSSPELPADFCFDASLPDISRDGQRVFFKVRAAPIKRKGDELVEVWNGNDAVLYPMRKALNEWKDTPKLMVWDRARNTLLQLTDETHPKALLSGDGRFAITFNPLEPKPQFKQVGNVDFFITDLSSGGRKMVLEQQCGDLFHTLASPGGKYIVYFKNEDWWCYEIAKDRHTNLTAKSGIIVKDKLYDMAGEAQANGIAGFSEGDKSVMVYDRYDIWEIPLEQGKPKRLTKGREQKRSYRRWLFRPNVFRANYNGFTADEVSLDNMMLQVTQTETFATGFARFRNGKVEPLYLGEEFTTDLLVSGDGQTVAFARETFSSPTEIVVKKSRAVSVLFASNSFQRNYAWGRSELVRYEVDGNALSGILYYPARYDKQKTYPMVVHIYSRQSQDVYRYITPTRYDERGFNITDYTLRGYFVLLPDIAYRMGEPGLSALRCVKTAVDAVKRSGVLNGGKIGLIGHSFGGFETNYIVTQTDLFAAAVSGAGMSDITSMYLGVGWNDGQSDMWRFESQQWRMGKSFYEAKDPYLTNSPVLQADCIVTPLLAWTGREDKQVNASQNLELYLALRRLGKPTVLLRYPGEQHVLLDKEKQLDLSEKIAQWFDYFLKDEPPAPWIKNGL